MPQLQAQLLAHQGGALFVAPEVLQVGRIGALQLIHAAHQLRQGVNVVLRGGAEVGEHVDQHLDRAVHLLDTGRGLSVQGGGFLADLVALESVHGGLRAFYLAARPLGQLKGTKGVHGLGVHGAHVLLRVLEVALIETADAFAATLNIQRAPHGALATVGKAGGDAEVSLGIAQHAGHVGKGRDDGQRQGAAGLDHAGIHGGQVIALVVPPTHLLRAGEALPTVEVGVVQVALGNQLARIGQAAELVAVRVFGHADVMQQGAVVALEQVNRGTRDTRRNGALDQGLPVRDVTRQRVEVGTHGVDGGIGLPVAGGVGRTAVAVARVALDERADQQRGGDGREAGCEAADPCAGRQRPAAHGAPATISGNEGAHAVAAHSTPRVGQCQRARRSA